ncbi:30S ribosomal protein S16 [Sodalis-like secondary symbiont of Drepanosiphum platanoidis]|uniref:30S ribosomal protein S16 n=1 Tax=Sodalis-like secondary symbiont of Drepanosiphum platanoidis TaxID=2994493 RepID=UPI003464B312
MVIIRLSRGGSKKRPFYKIIVADNRRPRDGKFIEKIGFFNPFASIKDKKLFFNIKLFDKWVKNGAILSKKTNSLIKIFKKNMFIN